MLPTRMPSTSWISSRFDPPCASSVAPTGEPSDPPTSCGPVIVTPGIIAASWYIVPPLGMALINSGVTARVVMTPCTSTRGDCPVTVTVSATVPTFISAFTVVVKFARMSRPSRFTTLNPGSVNVTLYVPTGRLTTAYWPEPSVVAVRTLSMSAGLATSTDTPGSTAPVASLATPAIVPSVCAWPDAAMPRIRSTNRPFMYCRIALSPQVQMSRGVNGGETLQEPG